MTGQVPTTLRLREEGYALISAWMGAEDAQQLGGELTERLSQLLDSRAVRRSRGEVYAVRNLEEHAPQVRELAAKLGNTLTHLGLLTDAVRLVRAIYFDKPRGASWSLPWHRDTMVAVRPRSEDSPPIQHKRAGVPHTHGAPEVLAGMVTARLHLDRTTERNGALLVAPGSHRGEDTRPDLVPYGFETVEAKPGDVLLMRPLLLHRSLETQPDAPERRRVVHLEFSDAPSPGPGFSWALQ